MMSDWKPSLYLRFAKQRTQPAIDLAARIEVKAPKRILDIGCGPGNSTKILKNRWPDAQITGLDSSASMIAQAKETDASITWICADAAGDLSALGQFDIVFSNAAIQWMPAHEELLQSFYSLLNIGGVLAVQVPDTSRMPVHLTLAGLAQSEQWKLEPGDTAHSVFSAPYYYDILRALSPDIDLWETHYYHVMESHQAIVDWYRSTGMRPYLNALTSDADRDAFAANFEHALHVAYPKQKDEKVLFPFHRIFFMVRRV